MKRFKLFLIVLTFLAWPRLVTAGETHVTPMSTPSQPTQEQLTATQTSKPIEVGNKICPVSGEKVGGMGKVVQYEHEGKIYNFCCPMCLKDFKKDPRKYIKFLEKKGELKNTVAVESDEK